MITKLLIILFLTCTIITGCGPNKDETEQNTSTSEQLTIQSPQTEQQITTPTPEPVQKTDEELVDDFVREVIPKIVRYWELKNEKGISMADDDYSGNLEIYFKKSGFDQYFDDYFNAINMFPGNYFKRGGGLGEPPFILDKFHGIKVETIKQISSKDFVVLVYAGFNVKDKSGEARTYQAEYRFSVEKVGDNMKISLPMASYMTVEFRP